MIKEQVLSALRTLGFMPEEIEGVGYRFDFEGLNVLYSVDEESTKCVTLCAPGVYDITDGDRVTTLEAMVRLSGEMKYVQPFIMFGDKVWLNYQHYIGDNPVTPELIEHMVRVLMASTITFHKIINGEDNDD